MSGEDERKLLVKWVAPADSEHVHLLVRLAREEYDERVASGPRGASMKRAAKILEDVETHARGLARAIENLGAPGVHWALWKHRYHDGRAPGLRADWLRAIETASTDIIAPLAETARGARQCLPLPKGRGKPKEAGPLPLHWLIGQLSAIYAQHGKHPKPRRRLRGTEEPAHEFIRAVLVQCQIKEVPDDIADILRNLRPTNLGR